MSRFCTAHVEFGDKPDATSKLGATIYLNRDAYETFDEARAFSQDSNVDEYVFDRKEIRLHYIDRAKE